MKATITAYGLALVFFAIERLLRRGEEARSLDVDPVDQSTTFLLGGAYGLVLTTGIVLSVLPIGRLGRARAARPVGLAAMLAGLLLKVWAMRALGRFYTRTLRVSDDQPIVQSGPYRVIRHPGYLASLLVWIGFGLALANWLTTLLATVLMGAAYRRRIEAEEALLVERLGDRYRTYRRQTWRLLPLLY